MRERSRKVVITGVSGLVGFHLADHLCRSDPALSVVGVARSSNSNVDELLGHPNFGFTAANIVESPKLDDVLEGAQLLYHLAAESAVYRVARDPVAGLRTNVQGTLQLLLSAARVGVPKVVFTSGGAVYQNQSYAREETVGQPPSFYGASKLAAESYLRVAGNTLGLRHTILRLARVYGPRMTRGAIYDLIQDFRARRPANMYAHPHSVFDFVYVVDVVSALSMASGEDWDGVTANIGSGLGVRLQDLHATFAELFGYSVPLQSMEMEPTVGVLMIDRARALGWEPRYTLEKGLQETIRPALTTESSPAWNPGPRS